LRSQACRAYAFKHHVVVINQVSGLFTDCVMGCGVLDSVEVHNTATQTTDDMIVLALRRFIAIGLGQSYGMNQSKFHQQMQIPIDCSSADGGKLPTKGMIDLVGTWMISSRSHSIQNQLSLLCPTVLFHSDSHGLRLRIWSSLNQSCMIEFG
jgi:hypothetical protein